VWDQEVSVALLTSEFDKLGLRVGEKHLLAVLKADPNIGKNPMFLNAAVCLICKIKDREVDAELSAKYQIYNMMMIKSKIYKPRE
jgi:peptidyl-prolyl cis-trans isomerase D